MKHFNIGRVLVLCAIAALGACAGPQSGLSTPAGQLFCRVESVGGPLVVRLLEVQESVALGVMAPLAVIATGAAKSYVDDACAKAQGVPVSPPSNPATAPAVAVVLTPK